MIEKTSQYKQFCKRFDVLYNNSRAIEDASRRISLKYLSCLYSNLRLYIPTTNSKQTLSSSSGHICFSISNWKSLCWCTEPHGPMSHRKKIIHIRGPFKYKESLVIYTHFSIMRIARAWHRRLLKGGLSLYFLLSHVGYSQKNSFSTNVLKASGIYVKPNRNNPEEGCSIHRWGVYHDTTYLKQYLITWTPDVFPYRPLLWTRNKYPRL